jgi:hypothetical protein
MLWRSTSGPLPARPRTSGSSVVALSTPRHPGGCFSCRYFGERVDVAVWCVRPGREHVRSQAEQGCAFWERDQDWKGDQCAASA